ncbi:MbnP family protein [Tenacibaculum insulae]|uniref:MbnP family protein n=1 Tax=Tenacibaculum insulae TaxID=2029677 RepID=UPI003AB555BC
MKQYLILFLSLALFSCSSDSDEPIKEVSLKLKFTQNWDGATFENVDLNSTEFINKLSTKLTIERLRYLISKVTLTDGADQSTIFDGYKLIDLNDPENLTHNLLEKVSEGNYKLAITFGFNESDNTDGAYSDLNSASWNVPSMLGGGYHFMQLDGKYKDTLGVEKPYNFHIISAYNTATAKKEDTSFTVDLGTVSLKNNATIEIKMNIAGWFKAGLMKDPEDENLLIKNPKGWDLNGLHENLMGNFKAQEAMYENGKNGVFSLGNISQ